MKVRQYLDDENCVGVFNTINPRDDKLPSMFIHSSECWDGSGHSCPDLPDTSDHDGGVFVDHNFYHPTLHTMLDELLYGDPSLLEVDQPSHERKYLIG